MVFAKVLVPTDDTVRYTFLLDRVLALRKPFLVCGESGSSKTITIKDFMVHLYSYHTILLSLWRYFAMTPFSH
jgi:dynein heavy chain